MSIQTPQHQKIKINEDLTKTPSSLFVNLTLLSPSPKRMVQNNLGRSNRKNLFKEDSTDKIDKPEISEGLIQEKQSRKDLFKESSEDSNGDNIPQDICLQIEDMVGRLSEKQQNSKKVKRKPSIYQNARRALHSAFPTDMPGRENELNDLKDFIKQHLTKKSSGSLYISGPPGTGKTASLNKILEEEDISSQLCKVYVNCTSIKSPTAIYSRIAKELGVKINGKTEKSYLMGLENYLRKCNKMILLVLDEIDQLESKNQSILYTIFELPSKPNLQLILVGIANALDLTDRILPRLQARCELKPKLMHFAPYTKQQIVEILTSRLKAAGVLEIFSPVALQMLSGKVAAVSGDVRRAWI
ncbi:hypothetical protein NQ314_016816 [Rhamnusium bicolor]|uniref:AAA+ ATPase domain-containing protein n=1 Tax=Rhamnusium bicolor TaxID=1586634 RepID=A0AAV8WUU5_9CUCU|nr:hypothetical protein NQ314_016816 [Rhamnusium bicolor]